MSFHFNCGKRITLSNNNTTATRSFNEFNHGLVLSASPLEDNVLFEVKIDQKVLLLLIFHLRNFLNFSVAMNSFAKSKNWMTKFYSGVVMEWKHRNWCDISASGNGTASMCDKNVEWNLGLWLPLLFIKRKDAQNWWFVVFDIDSWWPELVSSKMVARWSKHMVWIWTNWKRETGSVLCAHHKATWYFT